MKDRMERAHAQVRRHAEGAMLRQKHYHDMKMSYEQFREGDFVYVYFPQRKSGCSPKLTSYWRGPFRVLAKVSEVLYKVNCGRNEKEQIVHCDRMKVCKKQVLKGEESFQSELALTSEDAHYDAFEPDVVDDERCKIEVTDTLAGETRQKRERRAPAWMKDFDTE